jgi:hypothetical protein
MATTKRDESGIVGVILTIVIVWALVAVVMLTRTLEAAQQIDTRVVDITASVRGANSHLNTGCNQAQPSTCDAAALPVLSQTEALVKQIDVAAKPLTGQAGQILTDVNSINTSVSSILATAVSINGTVHSIGGLAGSINSTVHSIQGSINGINADVVTIKGSGGLDSGVTGINNRASLILGVINPVTGIKADTAMIAAQAGAILAQAQGICADHAVSISLLNLVTVPATGTIC